MADAGQKRLIGLIAAGLLAGGAGWRYWSHLGANTGPTARAAAHDASHVHEHASPHGELPIRSLSLSELARQNLALRTEKIGLTDYWRSLMVPAEVIEEPGHCEQHITTTIEGIVRKIHILKGQSVKPGDPLFNLEVTSGPFLDVQSNLLRTALNLELVNSELVRIKPLVDQGTIPIRTQIEKQSEQKRLEILKHTEQQELLIRGMTLEQIDRIIESKSLLREFTVRVPLPASVREHEHDADHKDDAPAELVKPTSLTDYTRHAHGSVFTVEQIEVVQGELIKSGERLCQLALHTMLLIEGRAFEREASVVERVMKNGWPVEAQFETGDMQPMVRKDLTVLSIENALDAAGRTLKFYVPLVNEVFLDRLLANGISYRNWRFRPGQKVRLLLPVEFLKDRMVVPLDAVVREGADAYVFRVNGRLLERVPVMIEHQDITHAVLGRGSKLYQGEAIAMNQAYQLNLMLRQSESAGQPHDHDHDH